MSQIAQVDARSFPPPPAVALEAIVMTTAFATLIGGFTVEQGLSLSLCAEIGARIAIFAARYFTQHDVVVKTAARLGRVLGGYFLTNVVLQATGFVPLAFGICSALIPLATGAYIDMYQSLENRV